MNNIKHSWEIKGYLKPCGCLTGKCINNVVRFDAKCEFIPDLFIEEEYGECTNCGATWQDDPSLWYHDG